MARQKQTDEIQWHRLDNARALEKDHRIVFHSNEMKGKDESLGDEWISVASNDVHRIQLHVVCNFYGIWLSNNDFVHVRNLLRAHLKYFF